jgi:hypothetical protein
LLYDLTKRKWGEPTAWRAVWLLMLAPNTVYLSGVYTESLFLLFCVLTFWLLGRERFMLAAMVAGVASLTRSVGVALYPALLIYTLRPPVKGRYLVAAHIPILVFGSYVLGLGFTVGDPLAYFKIYGSVWGRTSQSIFAIFSSYFSGQPVVLWGLALSWIDLVATVFYLFFAIVTVQRNVPWGLFALLALMIPIASGSLVSMPRYGAIIFPFYVMIAVWARRRWQQALVYAISAGLALLFVGRFVTWHWIA